MKTEEGARVRQIAAELKAPVRRDGHIAGAESFVRYFYKKTESLLEYLPENTLVVIDEPNRLTEHAKTTEEEFRRYDSPSGKGYLLPGQMEVIRNHQEVVHRFHQMHTLSLSTMEPRGNRVELRYGDAADCKIGQPNNSFEMLVKDLLRWKKSGYRMLLLSPSRTRAARLAKICWIRNCQLLQ